MTHSSEVIPVLIAGGGPVGMTLALELARHGVASTLLERNATTTRHPKMDLTNGRSMELFRRLGIVDAARAAGVAEDQDLDIIYATSASGYQLYRFNYGSPAEYRQRSREINDGSMTLEPPMRVSQVMLEPVLKAAIDAEPLVEVKFGWTFDDFSQDASGVVSQISNSETGQVRSVHSQFLAACDGGSSRVRKVAGIGLEGDFGIVPIYMVHFKSSALDVLAKFGAAYHLQTGVGTLISQNGQDIWTLHAVMPPGSDLEAVDAADLLRHFAGGNFEFEILVANHWMPHQVVAERYREGRVLLAGDAAHQFIPTGGYGMNTGVWDAADLGWKLSAVINGWGGEGLLDSVEERRKIALQNRAAAVSNMEERFAIEGFIQAQREQYDLDAEENHLVRERIAAEIQRIGNGENESFGIEYGYRYIDSNIIVYDQTPVPSPVFNRLKVIPSAYPGCRLPHFYLADGSALYDRLGHEFTLLILDGTDVGELVKVAKDLAIPLEILILQDDKNLQSLGCRYLLIRPDQHIAWSGNTLPANCRSMLEQVVGQS